MSRSQTLAVRISGVLSSNVISQLNTRTYTPVPFSTAGIVCSAILKSSQSDQWSM